MALQQKPWLCVLEFMNYGDLRSVLLACSEKNIQLQPYEMVGTGTLWLSTRSAAVLRNGG